MPEYEITVSRANRPEGDPIDVPPFGTIPNGESKMVAMHPDQAKEFDGIDWCDVVKVSDEITTADEAWEDAIRQREAGILPTPETITVGENTFTNNSASLEKDADEDGGEV